MNVRDFIGNRVVQLVLVAVVLFGGGFVTGRWAAPPQTVVTEKVKEVVKDRIVEKVKTEVQVVKVYLENKNEKIHRVVAEERRPDGTEIKTTTESIGIETVVHENTNSTEIKYVDKIVEKFIDRIVEKEKLTLKQPDWHVAAGVGVAIPYFLGQGSPGVPGLSGAVINAEVGRRVVGPFWIGIHGNTQGVVGLNLSGVF